MRHQPYTYVHPKLRLWVELFTLIENISTESLLPFLQEFFNLHSKEQTRRKISNAASKGKLFKFQNGKVQINQPGKELESKLNITRQWKDSWEGTWFFLSFDLPVNQNSDRRNFWRHLTHSKLGNLQGSLWVSPFNPLSQIENIAARKLGPHELCILETNKILNHTNEEIVAHAWDWPIIEKKQKDYLSRVNRLRDLADKAKTSIDLAKLAREEIQYFGDSLEMDPFLPLPLWPKKYLGEKVVAEHKHFWKVLARKKVLLLVE